MYHKKDKIIGSIKPIIHVHVHAHIHTNQTVGFEILMNKCSHFKYVNCKDTHVQRSKDKLTERNEGLNSRSIGFLSRMIITCTCIESCDNYMYMYYIIIIIIIA